MGAVVIVLYYVVGFTTIYAISAYHHKHCEIESTLWQGVLNTTLCNQVWHVAGRWFTPFSSTNKTDNHNITEILLKVTSNIITCYLDQILFLIDLYINLNTPCFFKWNITAVTSECWSGCVTPNEQFFSHIMARTSYIFWCPV